jgi:tetratricopeptide (TPR) repeat protein
MHVGKIDSFNRHTLGSRDSADEIRVELDTRFRRLTLFPLGAIRRTAGPNGAEADLEYLPRVVDMATQSPELVTRENWDWMEFGQKYEPSVGKPPSAKSWFGAPLQKATPLLPLEARAEYDLRAMDEMADAAANDAALAAIQRRACGLSARDCIRLAWTLVRTGDTPAAAAEFERAFADPMVDAVAVANESSWLVNHYFEQKRTREAIELAERVASTFAFQGLVTSASLHERLDRQDEAEALYQQAAEQYNRPYTLLGYYYRDAIVRGRARSKPMLDEKLARTFSNGLQPEPTAMDKAPARGVYIYTQTPSLRRAGLRVGDIVVGLEGWLVESVEQYQSINAFFVKPEMKVTVWRGGKLVTIETIMPGRLFGVELKDYPLKGWIED